ncbi:MAG TPA: phospholipase D-like domain-containing protein, partial [Elusimicrobiota bacterium]|nr:phospholipase D-like domain-containing protein [Elusimicrobiota bacterium]
LLRAKNERNVHVQVVLDSSQAKLMKLDDWFSYNDFDVKVVAGPDDFGNVMFEKNHNKFMVIDGALSAMGSYNYSANAENNNFENVSFDDDPALAAFFVAYVQVLYDLGWKPFKPKTPPARGRAGAEFFAAPLSAQMSERHAQAEALNFE